MLDDVPTLAWMLVLFGASLIGWGVTRLDHAGAAQRWPHAEGVVSASRRIEIPPSTLTFGGREPSDQAMIAPEVQIDFAVGDREFRVRHPREAMVEDSLGLAADRVLARYPVGRRVTVAYDPAAPADALVVEAARGGLPGALLIGAGVVSFLLGLGVAWKALG